MACGASSLWERDYGTIAPQLNESDGLWVFDGGSGRGIFSFQHGFQGGKGLKLKETSSIRFAWGRGILWALGFRIAHRQIVAQQKLFAQITSI